jgi:hypothetical protein
LLLLPIAQLIKVDATILNSPQSMSSPTNFDVGFKDCPCDSSERISHGYCYVIGIVSANYFDMIEKKMRDFYCANSIL